MRRDFPKPKRPSLKPKLDSGRLTKSLEFVEESYGTGAVVARQPGFSKSITPGTLHNPEGLVRDFHKNSNRRVRSNTWTVDQTTMRSREMTLFEATNGNDTHRSGRTYRCDAVGTSLDAYGTEKRDITDSLRSTWEDPKYLDKVKR